MHSHHLHHRPEGRIARGGQRQLTLAIKPKAAQMHRLTIIVILASSLVIWVATPVVADVACGAGQAASCHVCSGTEACKALEKSGTCNGPITCGRPEDPCGCVAKSKGAATNSLNQKKPVSKSQ
jgi:hypothetical protein